MSVPVTIGLIASTLILGVPLLATAHALEARHRVSGAADAAALAAADAHFGWVQADPCEAASLIALSADASIENCDIGIESVTVTIAASTSLGTVRASSKAGVLR